MAIELKITPDPNTGEPSVAQLEGPCRATDYEGIQTDLEPWFRQACTFAGLEVVGDTWMESQPGFDSSPPLPEPWETFLLTATVRRV